MLIHDMPKVHVVGRRLPVTEAEATLIRSQQQRARLRYPLTPTDRLRLFPAPSKNPDGEKP